MAIKARYDYNFGATENENYLRIIYVIGDMAPNEMIDFFNGRGEKFSAFQRKTSLSPEEAKSLTPDNILLATAPHASGYRIGNAAEDATVASMESDVQSYLKWARAIINLGGPRSDIKHAIRLVRSEEIREYMLQELNKPYDQ